MRSLGLLLLAFLLSAFGSEARADGPLPQGFVFLGSVDPSIGQDIRYAGRNNFTRHAVSGYDAAECVLTEEAAKALSKVQKDLRAEGFSLLVYDCYRPVRAVRRFVEWAKGNDGRDPEYHPDIAARDLIAKGYIAARSGHSAGSTVDLTIRRIKDGRILDMGTPFDFFGPRSHTRASGLPDEIAQNRQMLVNAMKRRGFSNYRNEWWHFSLDAAPFKGRQFDFAIPPSK